MPLSTQAASAKPAMRAIVTDMKGGNRRECLVWDASPSGCRLSGNVDGLPDLISISVTGVAQPMRGRVVSRAAGSLAVTFAWSRAADPAPAPEEDTPEEAVELSNAVEPAETPILKPGQTADTLTDAEAIAIFLRLEKSLLARLG